MLPNTRAGRWIAKVATVSPGRVKSLGYKSARNLLLIWANFDPSRYLADRLGAVCLGFLKNILMEHKN